MFNSQIRFSEDWGRIPYGLSEGVILTDGEEGEFKED